MTDSQGRDTPSGPPLQPRRNDLAPLSGAPSSDEDMAEVETPKRSIRARNSPPTRRGATEGSALDRRNITPAKPDDAEAQPSDTPWWVNVNREVPMPRFGPTNRVRRVVDPPPVSGSAARSPGDDHPRPPTERPSADMPSIRASIGHAKPRAIASQRYGRMLDQPRAGPADRATRSTTSVLQKRSRSKILIAVGLLIVALEVMGLAFGLSKLGFIRDKVLDVSKAQAGVQQILMDPWAGYGAEKVTSVVCNNGRDPVIQKGATFTCEVVVDGRKRVVTAVFQDDSGTYEVDRPR
jgi:hypothetical protein